MLQMYNPVATYRLQFHKGFTFNDAQDIISYLAQLGIKTIYASPVFESTPSSTHGYDGTNPQHINPEIGTEATFIELRKELKQTGIGWIQDIVPNHMAFHSNNELLMDVLEKGQQSVYADFFDIDWEHPLYKGRLIVPVLGASLAEAIQKGEIKIVYKDGHLRLSYYDMVLPLNPAAYKTIFDHEDAPEAIGQVLQQMPETNDKYQLHNRWVAFTRLLSQDTVDKEFARYVDSKIEEVNKKPAVLEDIAESQYYRLCQWQETDKRINYRRFFTINSLICLNIHYPKVFDFFHLKVKELVEGGWIQGLRIDHIDGLYNPEKYLQDLRRLAGEDVYINVEKILEPGEHLPENWPVQGNTGYDFLSLVNNLLTNRTAEPKLTAFYRQLTQGHSDGEDAYHKKRYILYEHMAGELDNLYRLFASSAFIPESTLQSIGEKDIKQAIAEFLIQCPVYRYYGNKLPLSEEEAEAIRSILSKVRDTHKDLSAATDMLESVLLDIPAEATDAYKQNVLHFYMRCMQFTGPLMAKGVEDTLMYTYNRFIGHNDVGDYPGSFGLSVEEFHNAMIDRQKHWPLSFNATSTHDTKRGEDVRARLNVLTDIPAEWISAVKSWQKLNRPIKKNNIPDANDEYFIYQSVAGAYPMNGENKNVFATRLKEYIIKALREGKLNSNWAAPNEQYEEGTKKFIDTLFDEQHGFLESFLQYHNKIVDYGIINSLSQLVLKCTTPGVPDIYQGTELWDLSFVDPDNRRPVDYIQRQKLLAGLGDEDSNDLLSQLWDERYSGAIKLWLTKKLLHIRQKFPELFSKGAYLPLETKGKYRNNIIAFARVYKDEWLIVIVPLHSAGLVGEQDNSSLKIDWKDTKVMLPEDAPAPGYNELEGAKAKQKNEIRIAEVFGVLPLAVFTLHKPENSRNAGVLLHITSLPSGYGIGDIGPAAIQFADFLSRSKQKYWQLLPLNPIEAGSSYSPYSSISSMAGNVLLISPDRLAEKGLLDTNLLQQYRSSNGDKVDYKKAEEIKTTLFDIAYSNFWDKEFSQYQLSFESYCDKEAYWLDEFAVYVTLKKHNGNKPWHEWDASCKQYSKELVYTITETHKGEISKTKWLQFIFAEQWQELKEYCTGKDIQLLGDMPFYVSYDSADVWANKDIFCLDADGAMTGIAGVPPDYFSKSGQLWGMPTYNWQVLKERNYDWWLTRLKKNLELFNLIRLDHFRAFAGYWQVPAGEKTAINGKWLKGPGAAFFEYVQKELDSLPFIAEDLGDNMADVYELRDKIGLPGMKVLQFAFGEDMPQSVDIPHNYKRNCIVYTGTHDNNTTAGWFRTELPRAAKKQVAQYTGQKVNDHTINDVMARLAYASVADTVILPMQDIIGLNESARMNTPGSNEGNWLWQLRAEDINAGIEEQLRKWCTTYFRG